jgi:23S rRNA (guanosine2251-2'-O)-methyltransferase
MADGRHIRNQFLTIYGKKPVVEMLESTPEQIAKVFVTKKVSTELKKRFSKTIERHKINWVESTAFEVSRISKSPKQDQGIACDIRTPRFDSVENYISTHKDHIKEQFIIALDQVTTPANVGLIVRSATGLGADAILIPYKGSSKLSSLVVKASAGVLLNATVLRCEHVEDGLKLFKKEGLKVYGLSGEKGVNIYKKDLSEGGVFVLGNETHGVSEKVESLTDHHLMIPMHHGVESLNVACAASVVMSEINRVRQNN